MIEWKKAMKFAMSTKSYADFKTEAGCQALKTLYEYPLPFNTPEPPFSSYSWCTRQKKHVFLPGVNSLPNRVVSSVSILYVGKPETQPSEETHKNFVDDLIKLFRLLSMYIRIYTRML